MKSKKDVKGFNYTTKRKSIAIVIDIVKVRVEAGNLSPLQSILDILCCTKNIKCLSVIKQF